MTTTDNKRLLAALEANWQAEMEGHYTYMAFAKNEVDPQRRNALRGLAAAEKHHADLWAGRIQELGAPGPQYRGDLSGQAASLANRVGGADLALRRLEIDEGRDIAKYGKQLKALGDQLSVAILEEVIADEREHYQTWRLAACLPLLPQSHLTTTRLCPLLVKGGPRLPGVAPCPGKGGSRLIPHGSAHWPAAKKFVAIA
jgi:rubrerythrin